MTVHYLLDENGVPYGAPDLEDISQDGLDCFSPDRPCGCDDSIALQAKVAELEKEIEALKLDWPQ